MTNIPNYLDRFAGPYLSNEEAQAIYSHLHNVERWFGSTAGVAPAVALPTSLAVPYQVTAGDPANTFGTEILLIDGTETLGKAFQTMYDPHRLEIVTTSGTGTFLLRMAFNAAGEANFAAAVNNGHYSDFPFIINSASDRTTPVDVKMGQITIGATGKLWAALACTTALRTADLFLGIHLYPARPGGIG
jgi:hypothetical protein